MSLFCMLAWAEVCHLSQSSKSILTGFVSKCMQYWLIGESLTRHLFKHTIDDKVSPHACSLIPRPIPAPFSWLHTRPLNVCGRENGAGDGLGTSLYSLHANQPYTNSVILNDDCFLLLSALCACVQVNKNGIGNEAIVLHWPVWSTLWNFKFTKKVMSWCNAQCKMLLFCVKTIMEVTQFWTSPSDEE